MLCYCDDMWRVEILADPCSKGAHGCNRAPAEERPGEDEEGEAMRDTRMEN